MCLASDSSNMRVCFMITKDCDRLFFASGNHLLVDRGPQSSGQPSHAWLGLWRPRQIPAHRPPPLAAYQPNGSNQSRCSGPCNCTQRSPVSALVLLEASCHNFCSRFWLIRRHAAPSQRHGHDAEGWKAFHSCASEVCHLLCQQWPHDPGPDDGLVRAPDCTGSGRQGLVQVSQDTLTAQQAPETARDCPAAMTLLAM